jgi:beta-glucanase (GH16 family)
MSKANNCIKWADKGSYQCSQWKDEGVDKCNKWADEGYNSCSSWGSKCHWYTFWNCIVELFCNGWYWVANLVCKVWYWVANLVCQAWYWVAKWVCIISVDVALSIGTWITNAWLLVVHLVKPIKCGINENPIEKTGWELTFNDEFLVNTLDTNLWRPRPGYSTPAAPFHPGNIINQSLPPKEYFDPSSISIANSILTIESTYAPQTFSYISPNGTNYGNWTINYKTGWIETIHFKQLYGYFEIRCKIPDSNGAWPAFWLAAVYPDPWPPEIDIFEFYTSEKKKSFLHATIHWKNKKGKHKQRSRKIKICDASKSFNIYALEWTPNYLKWYFNNKLILKEIYHVDEFKYKFQILINGAMEDFYTDPSVLNGMQLPHKYEIDYVRVYKK